MQRYELGLNIGEWDVKKMLLLQCSNSRSETMNIFDKLLNADFTPSK